MNEQEAGKLIEELLGAFPRSGRKVFRKLLEEPTFLDACCSGYEAALLADPSVQSLGSPNEARRIVENIKRHGLLEAFKREDKPSGVERILKIAPGLMRRGYSDTVKLLRPLPGGRSPDPPKERERKNLQKAKERITELNKFLDDGLTKTEAAHRIGLHPRTLQRAAKLLKASQPRQTRLGQPVERGSSKTEIPA